MIGARGAFALVSSIALAFSLFSQPAFAASPKAGGSCAKVGQKVLIKKTSLSCTKIGKKLTWKVVVAKSKAPSGVKLPTVFTLPLNFDNLSKDTPQISWLLTKKALEASRPASVVNKVIKGPNVSEASVGKSNAHLQRAINLISKYWIPDKITSIFFNEKDGSWIDDAIVAAGGDSKSVTPQQQPYSIALTDPNFFCNTGTAQLTSNGPLWVQCLGTNANEDGLNSIAAHEYFHLFQDAFKGTEKKVQWADEGTANFFGSVVGIYLGTDTPQDIWLFRTLQRRSFDSQLLGYIAKNDLESIAGRFKQLESSENGEFDYSGYMLGQYASEVLIAVGGWDRFMQLNMRMGNKSSFSESFRTLYGLSLDEFYPKVAAYVVGQK
jgi:hypothetical protein